ncbi:MAG: hypothetical protein NZ772_00660 [Cyanobacteria bacterium]|nr:hypothetical protein [Cyanobacteriota bacterium]MDW8199883.1 hypothetical protein [Cyanobacteriota bacterium SKYGB_h_bin112]
MLTFLRSIVLTLILAGITTPVVAQMETDRPASSRDAQRVTTPIEVPAAKAELTRLERRLAQAACRALRSEVLADALVAQLAKSLANRGVQGDVLAVTTTFVDEALAIGTDELCLVR